MDLESLKIGTVFTGDISCLLIHLENHSTKRIVEILKEVFDK